MAARRGERLHLTAFSSAVPGPGDELPRRRARQFAEPRPAARREASQLHEAVRPRDLGDALPAAQQFPARGIEPGLALHGHRWRMQAFAVQRVQAAPTDPGNARQVEQRHWRAQALRDAGLQTVQRVGALKP